MNLIMKYLELKRNQNKIYRFIKTVDLIIKKGRNVNIIFINGLWLEVYICKFISQKKNN